MFKLLPLFRLKTIAFLSVAILLNSCATHLHSTKINGVPSDVVWLESDQFTTDGIPSLVKKNGEDFKVLLFADIQIDKWNRKGKKHSFRLMKELIETTKPDLIITLGDNTQGYLANRMALKLIDYLEDFDIPWAVTFGNHDSEGRRGRAWHGNQYEGAKNSLFSYGPSNIHGVGNYPVLLKNEQGDIIYSFIMMDSNVTREYGEQGGGYDFIHKDQIDWYNWQ